MATPTRTLRRGLACLAAALVVVTSGACGGGGGGETFTQPPVVAVASVSVAPIPAALYVGASVQLVVTTRDASGATLTGRSITFSSSNGAVASVSAAGVVSAASAGTTVIHVLCEGQSTDVTVTVALVPVTDRKSVV